MVGLNVLESFRFETWSRLVGVRTLSYDAGFMSAEGEDIALHRSMAVGSDAHFDASSCSSYPPLFWQARRIS